MRDANVRMEESVFEKSIVLRRPARTVALVSALLSVGVHAQSLPRRTECLQWDLAYIQTVMTGVAGAAIASAVLASLVGLLLGRQFWWATAPHMRIWIIAGAFVYPIVTFLVVGWPRLIGFQTLLYGSIDPRYVQCESMSFNAPGLFQGLIGQGVAAYGQWPVIAAALLGASMLGAIVALLFSRALVRIRGLAARAHGGQA